MKFRYLILLILPLLFNCPKKYAPEVEKIEVIYISSLYEDIYRENPVLAGIKDQPGIKIGYLKTDPRFMSIILGKLGFYELLNQTGIDFVIGDAHLFRADNINYFFIPASMGYAIKNYKGIRFAILSKDKDSLTIDDEIRISLIRQRSDILWIVDNNFLNQSPTKVNFFIKDRELADTNTTAIKLKPDTTAHRKILNFKKGLEQALNKKIFLENKNLDEYVLSKIALNEDVNVILYPDDLFRNVIEKDTISLRGILSNVDCELKFRKTSMTKTEALALSKEKAYKTWGKQEKTNQVLLPDSEGRYLFDLFRPGDPF